VHCIHSHSTQTCLGVAISGVSGAPYRRVSVWRSWDATAHRYRARRDWTPNIEPMYMLSEYKLDERVWPARALLYLICFPSSWSGGVGLRCNMPLGDTPPAPLLCPSSLTLGLLPLEEQKSPTLRSLSVSVGVPWGSDLSPRLLENFGLHGPCTWTVHLAQSRRDSTDLKPNHPNFDVQSRTPVSGSLYIKFTLLPTGRPLLKPMRR